VARKEYKDEQLLARLIGAGVLLAIAVIVLPFILDGSGSQQVYEHAEPLPAEPSRPVVESSYSSRQPPLETSTTPDKTTVVAEKLAVARPVHGAEAPAADNDADGDAVPGTPPEPVQAAPLPTISIPIGWNIQVASFVVESNAVNLLEDLKAQNLPAFANAVEGPRGTVFRVFAGPLDNQIDALDLQNRLNRRYRVESIMVRRD
jgi:DedD protein